MSSAAVDTGIYHNGGTYAEHVAWLAALQGDEYRIVHMPSGHLMNLAYASYFKYALLTVAMPASERMRLLEGIADMVFGSVTAEAVAAVEPACKTAVEMFHELHTVHPSQVSHAFREGDMFRLFAKLNPSLLRALELCRWPPQVPERSN